jgi:hypothetical protein
MSSLEYPLKRPAHNQQYLEYTNDAFRFVTSVVVERVQGSSELFDADIFGTHARGDVGWERIPAEKKIEVDRIIFSFRKPANYAHFKLNIIATPQIGNEIHPRFTFITPQFDEIFVRALTGKHRIVFLGCARNCHQSVMEAIELFELLGRNFADHQIAIVENDSTDGTDQILRDLHDSRRVNLIQYSGLDVFLPKRTQRLAFARNVLLSFARDTGADYFCVADLDGVLGSASPELERGFLSNFLYEPAWDAVFPITAPGFYDLYAFRHGRLAQKDFELVSNQTPSVITYQDILEFQVGKFRKLKFETMRGWLEVDSAFGGMGIYKTSSFAWSNYFGSEGDHEVCEHIGFHQKAALQGAKFYMNPEFIIGRK